MTAVDSAWIKSKLRLFFEQLPYLPRALGLVWQAAPALSLFWLVMLCIQGVLPAAVVLLLKKVVDELVVVIGAGATAQNVSSLLVPAVSMGAILLLQAMLRGATRWVREKKAMLVQDYISGLVYRQSVALDLSFYDSHTYYDHLHRAREDAKHRPMALLESLGTVLRSTVTLVAMMAVLIPYGWWLPLVLIVSTLPALFVVLRYTIREHDWHVRTTSMERKAWYYGHLVTADNTAAELRLFDLGQYFIDRFRSIRERLRGEYFAILKQETVAIFLASLFGLLAMASVMVWMVWQAMDGRATLGDLVLFYQAFRQGQELMRALLESVGGIYRNVLFLQNLFEFLALRPQVLDKIDQAPGTIRLHQGIRFDSIAFSYPGSDRAVFDGLDLYVPAGGIVAIVGANGAGKSTLIKLLCRLYDPDNGSIYLDGQDLRALSLKSLRQSISILFQQPVPYQDSVSENINLGALEANSRPEDISAAARQAGADEFIHKLPHGYDTQLGKWFEGGVDLSVGEWQRIALARAFLRKAPIIVLDEPTSAMDPWSEADWLDRFCELASGRTAIIITHRFTTARVADTIHVMDAGKIIESGDHAALMALNGRYAESWRTQTGQQASAE